MKIRVLSSVSAPILFAICEAITMMTISGLLLGNMYIVAALTLPNLAITLSSCVLFFIIYWSLRIISQWRKKHDKGLPLSANLGILLAFFMSLMVAYYTILVARQMPENSYLIPWGFCLFMAMLVVDIYLLIGSESGRKRNQLERELSAMRQQEEYLTEMVRMHEESIDDMRTQSHDYKRHLELIQELVDSQQIGEAETALKQYMADVNDDLSENACFGYIKNAALRLILDRTAKKCRANGINLETIIRYSDFDFMTYQDICIMVDNAMDNAIEACRHITDEATPRWISITTNRQKNIVLLKILNSKINEILVSDGGLISSKPNPHRHGIGLKNVKRVAAKYNGHVVVQYEKTEFTLLISVTPQPPTANIVK